MCCGNSKCGSDANSDNDSKRSKDGNCNTESIVDILVVNKSVVVGVAINKESGGRGERCKGQGGAKASRGPGGRGQVQIYRFRYGNRACAHSYLHNPPSLTSTHLKETKVQLRDGGRHI